MNTELSRLEKHFENEIIESVINLIEEMYSTNHTKLSLENIDEMESWLENNPKSILRIGLIRLIENFEETLIL